MTIKGPDDKGAAATLPSIATTIDDTRGTSQLAAPFGRVFPVAIDARPVIEVVSKWGLNRPESRISATVIVTGRRVTATAQKPWHARSKERVRLADGTVLETSGAFTCPVRFGDRATHLYLVVMPGAAEPLLMGYNSLRALGAKLQCASKAATCQPNETPTRASIGELVAKTMKNQTRHSINAPHGSPQTAKDDHHTTERP
uniref:Uncharacterized protein n=1 Tax=Glossina palpalis gambiensis TaxID=67801 RepID=A0A1B0AXY5_9MUSC